MEKLTAYAPLVGRVLMAVLFLIAGVGKISDVAGFTGFLTSGGLPAFLAWPTIIFEFAVAASLILGFQVRIMAVLAAGFCLVSGLLYHFNPADQMAMTMFFKNVALAGGFLFVFAHGAGAVAWDKR